MYIIFFSIIALFVLYLFILLIGILKTIANKMKQNHSTSVTIIGENWCDSETVIVGYPSGVEIDINSREVFYSHDADDFIDAEEDEDVLTYECLDDDDGEQDNESYTVA